MAEPRQARGRTDTRSNPLYLGSPLGFRHRLSDDCDALMESGTR
ncbi:hypothetical protein STRTUCAR8_01352 [Streptomyces turgidiscabies Car8]|uniref:Uncharacterized protein n=1 Tax=Streptomyces turgidiscabies (strain Car8) TaxID=698760 RepID=L7F3I4_STRT8|nr:hypothetical protein STRTUCAR8_01352 [Streptomyces turgidiscabies Car8]